MKENINISFESEFNKTNFLFKDGFTENDTKSINTNLSNLNLGNFSSNKFLFKGSIIEHKKIASTNSLTNDILKDMSGLGLTKIRSEKEKFNNKLINLNNEKYQDSWIDIDSTNISKIVLIKVVDQCYFEGHLHLKSNLNTEHILVKFINKKNYYMITPSIFFIKPRNEIIINIKRFCKLAPEITSSKSKESILMIAKKITNKVDDLNDVKIYLKSEDIYSPDYQLFSFSFILDNGYNPIYYDKLIEDRKKAIEAYYAKTNINEITNINTLKEHVENMRINIKEYKNKIKKIENEFEMIFEKSENQNIIKEQISKQEKVNKIMVDKEEFFEVGEDNMNKGLIDEINPKLIKNNVLNALHDENGITIPMILFLMSIGLFIGKFIKVLIFK